MFATVEAVEKAFYKAIEDHDLEAMKRIWGQADDVIYVGPDGQASVGRAAVLETLAGAFATAPLVRFDLVRSVDYGTDTLAVRVNRENVTLVESDKKTALVGANNFRREADGWRVVLHQATRIAA